jgi:hypothetical protein
MSVLQNNNGFNTNFNFTSTPISGDIIITIQFAIKAKIDSVTKNANFTEEQENITSKLGWTLGFRQPSYTFTVTSNSLPYSLVSESIVDINGPRYLFLAIDEFNNSAPQSRFISMLPNSLINKNILARISLSNNINYYSTSFASILSANEGNGLLISDKRQYSDDIDLQKLHVQLLDEYGRIVSLNGMNFSFLLEIQHT